MAITLKKVLKQNNYSLTEPRKIIFDELLVVQEPITMSDLIQRVSSVVDRASVYRTIDVFEKTGVVSRVQIGWKYKLELSDTFSSHHHHITCNKCGSTISFHESEQLERILEGVARENNFLAQNHTLELNGICAGCR